MRPEVVIGRALGMEAGAIRDESSSATIETWDSLGHITLILELESTYGVHFSVEETLAMRDFASIKQLLTAKGVRW